MKFELKVYHRNISDDALIKNIKRVAKKLDKNTLTTSEYRQQGKFSPKTITNRFGSWPAALEKAGLEPSTINAKASDKELFDNLRDVWTKLERQPRSKDMKRPLSKFSDKPYIRRFGSWQAALKAFVKHMNAPESDAKKTK